MQTAAEAGNAGAAGGILAVLYGAITRLETFLCFAAFIAGTAALFADIVGRELFGFGIFGAQRIAVYCMAVAGVLGFSYVVSQGGHLRPTILDKLVPARLDPLVTRLGDLLSAAICLGLAVASLLFVRGTYEIGEYSMTLPIPIWTVQTMLPAAFAIAGLKYLLFVLRPALRPVQASSEL
ncbi:TRAP transporter small permease [Geminicoccaceae bacterium 1502E]|nr:TRAP transporter small permease [Geminicoccaceae bacterium 1502E]